MKNLKSFLSFILVLSLVLVITGCGGSRQPAENKDSQPVENKDPQSIGNKDPQSIGNKDLQPAENKESQPAENKEQPIDTDNPQPSAVPTDEIREYSFDYNGTEIVVNAEAEPIIAALGEPMSITEEPSCAFQGLDRTYFYGSFYISTYESDGREYVFACWFADDSVETKEGIYLGCGQSEVSAAYGEANYNGSNAYIMKGVNTKLTVILENGEVVSIQYSTPDM